jgi:hypothetical protein
MMGVPVPGIILEQHASRKGFFAAWRGSEDGEVEESGRQEWNLRPPRAEGYIMAGIAGF